MARYFTISEIGTIFKLGISPSDAMMSSMKSSPHFMKLECPEGAPPVRVWLTYSVGSPRHRRIPVTS